MMAAVRKGGWLVLVGMVLLSTGCQVLTQGGRYVANRYYDARDLFAVGAGVTAENHVTGPIPPSLGLYAEATDWMQLGAITFNGYSAESDLRGTFVGPESRQRFGFLWWQMLHINQDYDNALFKNKFKDKNFSWNYRMRSLGWRLKGRPAKRLDYEYWASTKTEGTGLLHRGWHYWAYTGVEGAICDPFVTHLGVSARVGVDPSEFSDFVLGFAGIDFKGDDMRTDEFLEFLGCDQKKKEEPKPAPAPKVEAAPTTTTTKPMVDKADYDALAARNKNLADELAKLQGRLKELENQTVEIRIPETVLFDTGVATLKPEGQALLDKVSEHIKRDYTDYEINIQGHTDDRPVVVHRKQYKSNWELGSARSLSVLHYLIERDGLDKAKFSATTFADNKPIASNETAEGRQENRRAAVVLTMKKK